MYFYLYIVFENILCDEALKIKIMIIVQNNDHCKSKSSWQMTEDKADNLPFRKCNKKYRKSQCFDRIYNSNDDKNIYSVFNGLRSMTRSSYFWVTFDNYGSELYFFKAAEAGVKIGSCLKLNHLSSRFSLPKSIKHTVQQQKALPILWLYFYLSESREYFITLCVWSKNKKEQGHKFCCSKHLKKPQWRVIIAKFSLILIYICSFYNKTD